MTGGCPVPPWKTFLNVPSNKQSFVNFLSEYVVSHASQWLAAYPACTLLVVGSFSDGELVKSISSRCGRGDNKLSNDDVAVCIEIK